jgi:hypothetical protein
MRKQLAKGFIAFMTRGRKPTEYGIGVTALSADGSIIHLNFVFRCGHRYCCGSAACHHGLLFDSDYERLRECCRQAGVVVPTPMTIHMKVMCERGAMFAINPGNSQPQYEAATGWTAEETCEESDAYRVDALPRR